jgi:hypothetical protein
MPRPEPPSKGEQHPSPGHREEVVAALADLLSDLPDVRQATMFGFPAFLVGRKLFACVYGNGVAVKLPPETLKRLRGQPGIEPFEPYGKKMREWVLVAREDAAAYEADKGLFLQARDYVASGLA